MLKINLILFFLFPISFLFSQENITISGYLKDPETKEVLLYSKITVIEINKSVLTNEYGYFSIQAPSSEKYTLKITSTGYITSVFEINGKESFNAHHPDIKFFNLKKY